MRKSGGPSQKPVRGSSTGRPVMRLLDVLGRRWALRILWELRDARELNFRALGAAAGDLSPSVLNSRLKELRDLGVIELGEGGYRLSAQGQSLMKPVLALDEWARTHLKA